PKKMSPLIDRITQSSTVCRKEPIMATTAITNPRAVDRAAMLTALRLSDPERYLQPISPAKPRYLRKIGDNRHPSHQATRGVNRENPNRIRKADKKAGQGIPWPTLIKAAIPAIPRTPIPMRKLDLAHPASFSSNSSLYQTARTLVREASRAGTQEARKVAPTARTQACSNTRPSSQTSPAAAG
ncbi:MAG TPA: hypothetical protein DCY27_02010, partial [Desulfobacterales bacterium]|nr:hypothetical protein [Desulfobacterales bacterium]